MKILKEAKENLPVAFITSFVADGWEKVGILKEQIEAIKKEFKGTKVVEDLIQDLVDAYLMCIGQMEKHLADKDYLDIPDVDSKEDVKESLVEDLPSNVVDAGNKVEADLQALNDADEKYIEDHAEEVKVEESVDEDKEFEAFEKAVLSAELPMNNLDDIDVNEDVGDKKFSFDLLDFDEPDFSQPALTDDDIYGKR